ncbi:armadillo-type protein [Mycotypha africana]|uniref:armadillo-type protein n=1 Tax=Mycotypha africana TaxID=64632 RepID=UPI0023018552|nr:armadillo-type protein [Mycotypha africana]KAI8991801.1 armadillo-type protein [Mycotypha africana]
MKEYLIRLIHCHMLGYDVDFSIIYAIMATQSGETEIDRRVGKLSHELGILLINTLLRDLKSQNYIAVCAALNAVSYIEPEQMLESVLDCVIQAIDFPKQVVRKKAVMALYSLYKDCGANGERIEMALRKALVDKDISVVYAALSVWKMILMEQGASRFQDLLPVIYNIHRQIIEKRIHISFSYHGVMAPWAQLDCLKIYGIYHELDIGSPQELYSLVIDCLASIKKKYDMAFAIVLECIKLLAAIDPILLGTLSAQDENPFQLLVPYLQASNHNLKYLGLKGLTFVDKCFWKTKWLNGTLIADIIRTSAFDDTISSQSLEILDSIIDEKMLKEISSQLLEALTEIHDSKENSTMFAYWLANRLTDYCASEDVWFVETLIMILAESRKHLDEQYVISKCTLLKDTLANETDSTILREASVNKAYRLLARTNSNIFSSVFIQFLFWILGENGYLASDVTDVDIMRQLQKWIMLVEDEYLQIYGLQAIKKCITRSNVWLSDLDAILMNFRKSSLSERQATLHELTLDIQVAYQLTSILKDNSFERLLEERNKRQVLKKSSPNPYGPHTLLLTDGLDRKASLQVEQYSNIPRIQNDVSVEGKRTYTDSPAKKLKQENNLMSNLLELELQIPEEENLSLTTEQFGQLWLQYPCEEERVFECSLRQIRKLAKRLRKTWDLSIVQIVGEEFIAIENSSKVDPNILVHIFLLSDNTFKLTLRAKHKYEITSFLTDRGLE